MGARWRTFNLALNKTWLGSGSSTFLSLINKIWPLEAFLCSPPPARLIWRLPFVFCKYQLFCFRSHLVVVMAFRNFREYSRKVTAMLNVFVTNPNVSSNNISKVSRIVFLEMYSGNYLKVFTKIFLHSFGKLSQNTSRERN